MKPFGALTTCLTAALALLLATAVPLEAQRADQRGASDRNIAGQFDYYTLTLSWSPTYCAAKDTDRGDPQCSPKGRPYAFVLHGLWPQHERGWPESCRIREKPFVPRPLIDSMLDIMPSPRLVIHEYRKHGTCSGLDPDGYFKLSRQLFDKIAIPSRYKNPTDTQFVSPDDLIDEFITLNQGLRPDMLAVSCGGPGNRLREVRVCFTREGAFRACGRNEDQRRLCSANRMFVPPVRASRSPESGAGDREPRRSGSERAL